MFFQNFWKCLSPTSNLVRQSIALSAGIVSSTSRNLHILTRAAQNAYVPSLTATAPKFLVPAANPLMNQVAGFKVKGVVKRRCRDCYFVTRQGRLYNLCHSHPRHKQMAMKKRPKSEYIITHATQRRVRPW